jgi:hypothetical protein
MFGSEIVEVAIGVVFIYLLLRLICSAISELIERNLKSRAADLEPPRTSERPRWVLSC